MTPPDHGPEDGPDATATETPARKPRGVDPLSRTHRRRVLKALAAAAAAGDHQAARALLEVGAAIDRLKAEAEAEDDS